MSTHLTPIYGHICRTIYALQLQYCSSGCGQSHMTSAEACIDIDFSLSFWTPSFTHEHHSLPPSSPSPLPSHSLPPNYPCVPPVFEIEANQSGSFSYLDADELFDLLMAESINRIGGMMVFDLVTITQEFMPGVCVCLGGYGGGCRAMSSFWQL